MKLGTVTKLEKRNKTTSEKCDDDFMSKICDVIVIFPIFGQFEAIRKIKKTLIVKSLFSENTYVCTYVKILIFLA